LLKIEYFNPMKAVILAGGRGTRLAEETQLKPKPLVEAKSKPLIWHIMQNFSRFGICDFIILSGYKGQQIREYFANFWLHQADVTFDLATSNQEIHKLRSLPWKVTVLDTGVDTNTGGRIARLKGLLSDDFLLTYGDGVSDIDIGRLFQTHQNSNNFVTLTAVQPPARFGALNLNGNQVTSFQEKPIGDGGWVNGGFFVISPKIFDFLIGDVTSFEIDTLPRLASAGKLGVFKHTGYWQPVDTIRDLQKLEEAIEMGVLPWI
jgi:glucose-1-phosphate cytidylyltransferase